MARVEDWDSGKEATTYMTDNYGLASNNSTGGGPLTPTTPINMVPCGNGGAPGPILTAADMSECNQDTASTDNWGNIRFRHMQNTAANALMLDGHVQTFHYNVATQSTDLLELNINVNE